MSKTKPPSAEFGPYLERAEEIVKLVQAWRVNTAALYTWPNPRECLDFAITEYGEHFDGFMRRDPRFARNNERDTSPWHELGDVLFMVASALPRVADFPRLHAGVASIYDFTGGLLAPTDKYRLGMHLIVLESDMKLRNNQVSALNFITRALYYAACSDEHVKPEVMVQIVVDRMQRIYEKHIAPKIIPEET